MVVDVDGITAQGQPRKGKGKGPAPRQTARTPRVMDVWSHGSPLQKLLFCTSNAGKRSQRRRQDPNQGQYRERKATPQGQTRDRGAPGLVEEQWWPADEWPKSRCICPLLRDLDGSSLSLGEGSTGREDDTLTTKAMALQRNR